MFLTLLRLTGFLLAFHICLEHDCQAGGHHGIGRHVQPFLSTLQEKFRGEIDMADEEGETLGLL
jgi:hypothetical protein